MQKSLLIVLFFLVKSLVFSQNLPNYSPNEILLNMKKLNVLGSVLYVAAHPDDENTVMLSWLAKEKLVRTSYLSITRGDGGQNLIGSEQSELLGLIRTHELLAARAIDGPEQYFTSASDFGFSKTTEETLKIWDEEAVLGDVVWRIRNLRPDVIVCRFPPDARAGHGNHSASAYLAEKAFKVAANPTKYPEQLKFVKTWQAKRVVWNTFNFGGPSQIPNEKEYVKVEIGNFNPLLGKAYTEIAAESRSQHKSQGFGVPRRRGSSIEYFVHKDGDKAISDVFDGVDLTWKKVERSWGIENEISEMIGKFDQENPSKSIPQLIEIYKKVQNVNDDYWKNQKLNEIKDLIKKCAGLFFEANSTEYIVAQGSPIKLNFSLINRSRTNISIHSIQMKGLGIDSTFSKYPLAENILKRYDFTRKVPLDFEITQPYWLEAKKKSIGRYSYNDLKISGLPIAEASFVGKVNLDIEGQNFDFEVPLVYKYTDEIRGELYRPLEIRPKLTVTFAEKVLLFPNSDSKTIEVKVVAFAPKAKGEVSITAPAGWKVEPNAISFEMENKLEERKMSFHIFPPKNMEEGTIHLIAKSDGSTFDKSLTEINYEHVPPLIKYQIAEAKVIRADVKLIAKNIGYIDGAGDEVASALTQLGANVTKLTEADMSNDLTKYDAIVVGVRAYNVNQRMKVYNPILMKYVENGGNLVVQYQVNNFLQKMDGGIGPFPYKLSRDRVTVEEAEMRILKPNHALLNFPNKINHSDFDGWVQERGLYFSNEWDPKYEAILSSNDPTEKPMDGGLLYSKYGKGNYIFTGYAFFRQLPAGVSGAYRLFANLVSAQ
ncbi:MAG: PIG-L family deacetylase [Bacteroidota bacterium]